MRLRSISQVSLSQLPAAPLDFLFCASGYEERATSIAGRLAEYRVDRRIAIGFEDRQNSQRELNDSRFSELGFELFTSSGSSDMLLDSQLGAVARKVREKGSVSLFVDFSCMTKAWYSRFLSHFRDAEIEGSVSLFFGYQPSKYEKPRELAPNRHVGPIRGFSSFELPNRDTGLILGLGLDGERSRGVFEQVEAIEAYGFFADPAASKRFPEAVRRQNRELIDCLGRNHLVSYPLFDLRSTFNMLVSLAGGLKRRHRVILSPQGPKTFGLLCLLTSMVLGDVDVWRVSSAESGNIYKRAPEGRKVIVCRVEFNSA